MVAGLLYPAAFGSAALVALRGGPALDDLGSYGPGRVGPG